MKTLTRLLISLASLLLAPSAFAVGQYHNWAQQGGVAVSTGAFSSIARVQRTCVNSAGPATVTVYLPGTSTLVTLGRNSSMTSLSNPFSANAPTGFFQFWAADGQYDVVISGGGCSTYTIPNVTVGSGTEAVINVKAAPYLCKGDGVTDDTTCLQNALNDAIGSTVDGGLRSIPVHIPYGVYINTGLRICTSGAGCGTFAGTLRMYGDGIGATVLKLKAATNAVLLDIGYDRDNSLSAYVSGRFEDLYLDGNKANQTVANPVLRLRHVDRSWFTNIFVTSSKGDAISVANSSVLFDYCQAFASDGYGVNVEDSVSFVWRGGYVNDNTNFGMRFRYTGAAGFLVRQAEGSANVHQTHFENNVAGDIKVDSYDNVTITENNFTISATGYVIGGIQFVNGAKGGVVLRNSISNGPLVDGVGGSNAGTTYLYLDTTTSGNTYDIPDTSSTNSAGTRAQANSLVTDNGRNNSVDPRAANMYFTGAFGGHSTASWQSQTRHNRFLHSEDFTNAAWTLGVGGARNQVTAYGTPANPSTLGSDNATEFAPTVGGESYLQQNVTGLALVSGNMVTLSVFASAPAVTQIRLEIRDSADALLTQKWCFVPARVLDSASNNLSWVRCSVSYVVTGATSQINPRIVKYGGGASGAVYLWGAQFNEGDLSSYVPTGATADSANLGMNAFRLTSTEGLIHIYSTTFANLGSFRDGTLRYCSDCTKATPCGGGGTGALAKRLNGAWDCN